MWSHIDEIRKLHHWMANSMNARRRGIVTLPLNWMCMNKKFPKNFTLANVISELCAMKSNQAFLIIAVGHFGLFGVTLKLMKRLHRVRSFTKNWNALRRFENNFHSQSEIKCCYFFWSWAMIYNDLRILQLIAYFKRCKRKKIPSNYIETNIGW